MKDTENAALALLEATPAVLRELVGRLPVEIVEAPLDRGWSVKQMLAHFVDVEVVAFRDRLRRMVEEERPAIPSIDAMARIDEMGWQARSVESLLDELERERGATCRWLRTLTDGQLTRPGEHDTAGEISVSNVLHYWPTHDMAHLRHIQRMLAAVLGHEMGNAKDYDV
ncbi:MAG: DinB family protein [Thermomicrobiales bacterium]